jgi:hypothetical protein
VRSGQGAAAGAGVSRQARGVTSSTIHSEKKQGRVCERSGMEASASEPEYSGDEQSRPIFRSAKIPLRYALYLGRTDLDCNRHYELAEPFDPGHLAPLPSSYVIWGLGTSNRKVFVLPS